MAEANLVEQIDAYFAELLSGWNIYTTAIAVVLVAFLIYPLFTSREPDTHPLLLSRQSSVAPVRHPGESAVYRSPETPHGYPLKTGLGVKDPGAPKWSNGRTGDLRDVWRQTVQGLTDKEGNSTGQKGKILTVLGTERIIDHDFDRVSLEINTIGQYIQQHDGQRVAIYLPNSIEFLITLFAASFYGITPIIIPYDLSAEVLVKILEKTKPDILVAAAGSVPLNEVVRHYNGLKQAIWVVEEGSRHMDWNDVPEGTGGQTEVGVFHEIVDERKGSASSDLPNNASVKSLKDIVTVWQSNKEDPGDIIEFTHKNMVAAIAGLLSSLPTHQRVCHSDLFLPVDPFSNIYALTLTLAALYSNASLALNSSTGPITDLDLVTRSVSPTIVVASAETVQNTIQKTKVSMTRGWHSLIHWFETRTLTLGGRMPTAGIFTHIFDYVRPSIGEQPGKLRLLYVAERCGADCPPLESGDLSDLRAFTGARVIYALTTARVAGAVTQTQMYDYRREDTKGKHGHFGVPLGCVEVKVVDTETHKNTEDGDPVGEIVVSGPAVAGGQAALGVNGTFRDDGTFAYL